MPAAVVRLTDQCDNRCLFCAQRGLGTTGVDTSGAALARARDHAEELIFTGGEPGLLGEEALEALLSEAKTLGFRQIALQTNGRWLAAPGRVARLARAGLTSLHLSLHGAEAGVHDYHVGVPGGFVQTLSTFGAARALGLSVVVTTVLTRSNYRVLDPLPRLLRNSGAQAWNVLVPRTAGAMGQVFDRVMPRLAMALPFALRAVDAAVRQGLPAFIQGAPSCLLGPMALRALEDDQRAYAPVCDGCPSRAHCPGVDATYLERYQGDELLARASLPPLADHPKLRALFLGPGPLAEALSPDVQTEEAPTVPLVALGRPTA